MDQSDDFILEGNQKTPFIELNRMTGSLIFSGKSVPENAAKVYEPVLKWVSDYAGKALPTTNLRFDLEYFNTSSILWLTKILRTLSRISEPDYVLMIHLYVPEDEFDEISEFDDINDILFPITDILRGAVPNIAIKLYGKNDNGEVTRYTLILFEQEQLLNLKLA
jgi:hypothetical protein